MRTIIGLLILICLTGCTLRDPAGFAAMNRAHQLDRRFEAMERQMQADRWAAEDRHRNTLIQNQSRLGNIPY